MVVPCSSFPSFGLGYLVTITLKHGETPYHLEGSFACADSVERKSAKPDLKCQVWKELRGCCFLQVYIYKTPRNKSVLNQSKMGPIFMRPKNWTRSKITLSKSVPICIKETIVIVISFIRWQQEAHAWQKKNTCFLAPQVKAWVL